MRKLNSNFTTAFVSESGSELKNNDYFGFVELDEIACYVIADGIYDDVDAQSARLAIQSVILKFHEKPSIKKSALKRYLKAANDELLKSRNRRRMKASVTVVVSNYQKIRYACAGNTRLHIYRGSSVIERSKDMSLGREMVDDEVIGDDKLATHEARNNLYAYLGQDKAFKPFISKKIKLMDSDIIVMMTRGLWENVDDGELFDVFSEAGDEPQESVDTVEELLLSRQSKNLQNYSIAAIFANKIFIDPKRAKRIKKIIIISAIILVVAIIASVLLYLYFKDRREKREDMESYFASTVEYIDDNNFVKAKEAAEKAYTLAEKLRDKKMMAEIDAYIKLLDSIQNGDDLLKSGDYLDAQNSYLAALDRSKEADNSGEKYINTSLNKTEAYLNFYELMGQADALVEQGNYEAAIALYTQAKKIASAHYFNEGKQMAIDAMDGAYEKMSEESAEAKAKAAELAEKTLTAAELAAAGDACLAAGDYDGAAVYYQLAKEKFGEISDAEGTALAASKMSTATGRLEEREAMKQMAERYIGLGEQALRDGDVELAQKYYDLAKNIYTNLGMDEMASLMENKLAMDDPEAAKALEDSTSSLSTAAKNQLEKNAAESSAASQAAAKAAGELTAEEKAALKKEAANLEKRGDDAYDDDEYQKAKRYYRDAQSIYLELEMKSAANRMQDKMDDAEKAYQDSITETVNQTKEQFLLAQTYINSGDARYALGNYSEAIEYYRLAQNLYIELEMYAASQSVQQKIDAANTAAVKAGQIRQAESYVSKGDAEASDDNYTEARRYYLLARDIYTGLGMTSQAQLVQQKIDSANEAIAKAAQIRQAEGYVSEGDAEAAGGNSTEARRYYLLAKDIYTSLGMTSQAQLVQDKIDALP